MVTSRERDYMYQMYAADPRARLNLGIRRRLAPLMENDLERIKLMNSLLLSMPGSPIIYYGDEIGMGDNIYLGDRNGVRTPMQWSPDRNAGFSRADPQRLYLPPIMDPIYGYEAVNVEAQLARPLLAAQLDEAHARRCARRRRRSAAARCASSGPATARSSSRCASTATTRCCASPTSSRSAQPVELDLAQFKGRVPVELLGRTSFPPIGELPYLLTLPGYGFYWFKLSRDTPPPDWHENLLRDEAAGAGAVRRSEQLLARRVRPRGAARPRPSCAASSSTTCCRATSRRSAGTPARASASRARRSPTASNGGRPSAAGCSDCSTWSRRAAPSAISYR